MVTAIGETSHLELSSEPPCGPSLTRRKCHSEHTLSHNTVLQCPHCPVFSLSRVFVFPCPCCPVSCVPWPHYPVFLLPHNVLNVLCSLPSVLAVPTVSSLPTVSLLSRVLAVHTLSSLSNLHCPQNPHCPKCPLSPHRVLTVLSVLTLPCPSLSYSVTVLWIFLCLPT